MGVSIFRVFFGASKLDNNRGDWSNEATGLKADESSHISSVRLQFFCFLTCHFVIFWIQAYRSPDRSFMNEDWTHFPRF